MKVLRSVSASKKRRSFLKRAAALFFCVNALTFPLFADERDDLTAELKKAISTRNSDKMDIAEITRLLEAGADPNGIYDSRYGETFLYQAAGINNIELVRLLLEYGADPNQQGKNSETALMAVRSKEAVDLLISSGANPNLQEKDGETALMKIRWLKPAIALIQAGADPTIKNKRGQTVLHIWNYELIEPMFDDLISRGCKIDEPDNYERTPLIYTAYFAFSLESSRKKLFFLLEKGADPNLQDKWGNTALHEYMLRIEKEHNSFTNLGEWDKSVITALLEAGTNPAIKNDKGDSALITAIRISKEKKKLALIRDIVKKYASAEENKMASADERKTVSAERRKLASAYFPDILKALSFPVVIGGLSFLMKEAVYKDNPSGNFMGGLNAGLTLGGGGFILGAMIGASTAHSSGSWADMYSGIFEGLIGGVIGGTIGIVIACQPSVNNAFKNYSPLYYTPTAISGIIASVFIIRIWF